MLRLKSLLLVAFFTLFVYVPVQGQPKDEANSGKLTIGITQFPATFHPTIGSMAARSYILGMTRRPITTIDADWNLVCMLCKVLPTFENGLARLEKTPDGKDGIAVTYTLRPDAFWGDGVPVSTKDVLFTWTVGRHPMSGIRGSEFYRRIYEVVAHDAHTFTFHFDRVTFNYNRINAFDLLPAHIEEEKFRNPERYKDNSAFNTDILNKGLYNGPYRVESITHGSHIVLVPNDYWWGEKPKFHRIVIRSIENTAALEANLLSGSIDMIAGELGLTLDQALAFEKRHKGKYNVVYNTSLIYEHLDVMLDNPILSDKRVRQALIYGIDRQAISDVLFGGKQPVAHSSINPLDWISDPDVPKYPYDPEKAKALLEEAGWKVGKGGIRYNSKNQRLTVELMTTAGNRSRELVQQVLQSQWKQVGFDIRIRNQPARVYFGETTRQRKFKGLAMYAWYSAPESVPRATLYSDSIPTAENNWSGQNYPGFRNAEMDQLIKDIEEELDRGKRLEKWKRLQEVYANELPVIPLYFSADAHIWPKNLKGIVPTGHQYRSSLWVEYWYRE